MALLLLEAKFGSLPDVVKQRVQEMPPDELRQIMLEYHKAQSLKDFLDTPRHKAGTSGETLSAD